MQKKTNQIITKKSRLLNIEVKICTTQTPIMVMIMVFNATFNNISVILWAITLELI